MRRQCDGGQIREGRKNVDINCNMVSQKQAELREAAAIIINILGSALNQIGCIEDKLFSPRPVEAVQTGTLSNDSSLESMMEHIDGLTRMVGNGVNNINCRI